MAMVLRRLIEVGGVVTSVLLLLLLLLDGGAASQVPVPLVSRIAFGSCANQSAPQWYGDKNTTFFHATVIQRRQRNQMVKLKTEFGEWCDMDEAINNQLFSYFQKLFKALEARDMTEALSVVDCEVTEAMNADLTKPLTDAEIKLAAFQLGPLKAPCPDGFSGASGQLLNLDKSEIVFSANASEVLKEGICGTIGINRPRPNIKYLGLPTMWGRSKADAYGFLIERMVSKMQGWENNLLSHAGREVLIKAVVQAIPSYDMVEGARTSWAWASLLKGGELLLKGSRWQIHNGNSVRFWDDCWIPTTSNFKISSNKPSDCDIFLVSDVIDEVHKQWKLETIQSIISATDLEAIKSIQLSFEGCDEALFWPIWNAIIDFDPQIFIWLGDNIYGDIRRPLKLFGKERTIGPWKNVPRFIPSSEHEMQVRYDKAKRNDGYNHLRENVKVIGTWDDHDYGLNDAGKEFDGKITNQRLMLDFLDEPQDSPRRKQAGVYASYTFGPAGRQVKVILLDTRYHRDPLFSDGSILGNSQWTWLEKELNGPASAITIIGSSIQVISNLSAVTGPLFYMESWGRFPKERIRLFKLIADSKGRLRRSTPSLVPFDGVWEEYIGDGVFFISGDVHFGEITRYDCASGYPLYDITSSGLTQAVEKAVLPPLHFLVRFLAWLTPSTLRVMDKSCRSRSCTYGQPNFGAIEINWDATPVSLKIEVRDANGLPVMSMNSTLLELQARNSKITVEAGEYQKYCSLEVNLPWIVRYRLVIFFFCALAAVAACADIFRLYGYISLHAMSPQMQA
ncbi:unnamed protein product [Camellia sinensis]